MKQVILITAYKDLDFLSNILEYFDNDFDFYIHVDKKCKEDVASLRSDSRVHVYSKYRIEWGGSNHIFDIVLLIQEAFKVEKYEYYHLITGSDLPIKSLSEFKTYFENRRYDNFIEYFQLPQLNWGYDGGYNRICYYSLALNLFDFRGKWGKMNHNIVRVQKALKFKRSFDFFDEKLWGGGTYWSLSVSGIESIVFYLDKNPKYIKRFKYTAVGEEIFFQTILLNELELKPHNNSLRYIVWSSDDIGPKTLGLDDFESISKSNCFFARKFDTEKSIELMKVLVAQNDI